MCICDIQDLFTYPFTFICKMAACCRLPFALRLCRLQTLSRFLRHSYGIRFISTSGKKKDVPTLIETLEKKKRALTPNIEEKTETKDWISYGFADESEEEDRFMMKFICFITITVFLCGGAFILAYQPDFRMAAWIHREAYLELHRREELGLPLIDKELIVVNRIILPTDEELGETEIIL